MKDKHLELTFDQKAEVLQLLQRKRDVENLDFDKLPEGFYQIDKLPYFNRLSMQKAMLKRAEIPVPYFMPYHSAPTDTMSHQTKSYINFATYNYLNLNGHPEVNTAANNAAEQYGTSAASSRIVSGERAIHQELEEAIAKFYGTESSLVFVSGHATNVTVIGHLFGKNDLILHDCLAHNSLVQGAILSGAKRLSFPHNDMVALKRLLENHRLKHERVLIVTEGLYSMDGDTPPIHELVALKKQFKTFLMIDEAHSIGVLGDTGRGIHEHFKIDINDIDIWMGTLSKSFAGCGGYITGHPKLIDYLRFTAPGFIYSVGLAPPLAAASLAAIKLLNSEPLRVKQLREKSQYFLAEAKKAGLNTGHSEGYAIIPIIIGNSIKTIKLANRLHENGVITQPIIYPGVKDKEARLRFFINAKHTLEQMDFALEILAKQSEEENS